MTSCLLLPDGPSPLGAKPHYGNILDRHEGPEDEGTRKEVGEENTEVPAEDRKQK